MWKLTVSCDGLSLRCHCIPCPASLPSAVGGMQHTVLRMLPAPPQGSPAFGQTDGSLPALCKALNRSLLKQI